MKRVTLAAAALLGLAACANPDGNPMGPAATGANAAVGTASTGYTWTIKKELVGVMTMHPDGSMPMIPSTPYVQIQNGEIRWFEYNITWTRTEGGPDGPTATISDDGLAACNSLGYGFTCTSPTSAFGKNADGTLLGTWSFVASGSGDSHGTTGYLLLDVYGQGKCGVNTVLRNTATLTTSNGTVKSSTVETNVRSQPCDTPPPPARSCTYTQGYWKNHASAWPVASLTLGTESYSKSQLLAIFGQPVKGNGLVSLAHQLIAAKLNGGASNPAISGAIAQADLLIGAKLVPPVGSGSLATSATSSLVSQLDSYNNGKLGVPHCN